MEPHPNYHQFSFNFSFTPNLPYNLQDLNPPPSKHQHIQQQYPQFQQHSEDFIYFMTCFSPKETALSLKKRNDNLEMLDFENSDQDPDEIYNKRKKKVQDLLSKEDQLESQILQIKQTDFGKYQAIICFTKFIGGIKNNIAGIKTDYYSTKTFCALKNANESQVCQLVDVLKGMYDQILKFSENSTNSQSSSSKLQDESISKSLEFLIIPRFLISRQKINRLLKEQELQQNFVFLVTKNCLGHYNNESNKKMPTELHMKYIRELLGKKNGRQKFKKISSINHGNKFQKNESTFYYELYEKSFEYLKYLEAELKKGKKLANIRKKLENFEHEQSNQENQSSHSSASAFSFGSLGQELGKMQMRQEQKIIQDQLIDNSPAEFEQFNRSMKKLGVKKLMSMPNNEIEKKQRKFTVKKSLTMEQKKAPTIILIKPPSEI